MIVLVPSTPSLTLFIHLRRTNSEVKWQVSCPNHHNKHVRFVTIDRCCIKTVYYRLNRLKNMSKTALKYTETVKCLETGKKLAGKKYNEIKDTWIINLISEILFEKINKPVYAIMPSALALFRLSVSFVKRTTFISLAIPASSAQSCRCFWYHFAAVRIARSFLSLDDSPGSRST